MNFERLWANLKTVLQTLERMATIQSVQEGFAHQALMLMARREADEAKKGIDFPVLREINGTIELFYNIKKDGSHVKRVYDGNSWSDEIPADISKGGKDA